MIIRSLTLAAYDNRPKKNSISPYILLVTSKELNKPKNTLPRSF